MICIVASVTDADTIRCTDRTAIRIAGINAREKDGSCRHNAPCPPMRHAQAKPIVERLTLRRRLVCQPVGTSYRRVVARCALPGDRSLSCAVIAAGAAVRWDRYWLGYNLGRCQ